MPLFFYGALTSVFIEFIKSEIVIMNTNIPIYDAVIATNDDGISVMSLVSRPATQSHFVALAKEEPKPEFVAFEDAEQRILFGVVARADHPVYRNQNGREYYLRFSAETLRVVAEKMLYDGFTSSVDIEHSLNLVSGVHLQQLFIKDIAKGIDPKGFSEIEDGSLFAVYKVHNDEVWESVKRGEFKGFSLYGHFSFVVPKTEENISEVLADIYQLLRAAREKATN